MLYKFLKFYTSTDCEPDEFLDSFLINVTSREQNLEICGRIYIEKIAHSIIKLEL